MERKRRGNAETSQIEEIAAQLDDVSVTIEEVAADPTDPQSADKLRDAKQAVDEAVDTVDEIIEDEPPRRRR